MSLPPYPRLGECIRALSGALDTKASNRDVDRLAREGDFDWQRLDGVIDELLVDGLRRFLGLITDEVLLPWLHSLRDRYCRLVLDVSLDAIERSQALPVLIQDFFVPSAAQLLAQVNSQSPGPDLGRLLAMDAAPLAVVFDWLDGQAGGSIDKCLYPASTDEDKANRDKLGKWRRGPDLPSGQHLKLLLDALRAEPKLSGLATTAGVWLLTARALAYFDRLGGESARPLIRRCLQTEHDEGGTGRRLQGLVAKAGSAWPQMTALGRPLWNDLRRTSSKAAGDQASTWDRIERLAQVSRELDPDALSAYHLAWMKGRWHALSGQYEDAVTHYELAFELACYRAGHQLKEIVADAICIAAFLGKNVFVKQLKQVGITLGLFERPSDGSAAEDWELEQLAQQLLIRFPPQGRFVESEQDFADSPTPGLMTFSLQEIEAVKPDLAKPNRTRAVRFGNGVVRRWPQLRLFASFGRLVPVRALLAAGALVDELDSAGGSALLCAIQHAKSSGERAVLDLLLSTQHQASTLNTWTARKRLTPLICAIDLGEPDVVQKLLEQGASADQVALTDDYSPLFYTVTKIYGRVHPQRMLRLLAERLLSEPDAAMKDTLRRFGVASAGAFGDDISLARAEPELALNTAKTLVEQQVRRHSEAKLRQIIALLLRFGADSNRGHRYPIRGYTPLMLAAESDLPAVFQLMVEHGGAPLNTEAQGRNCWDIARGFGSRRVLSCLQR